VCTCHRLTQDFTIEGFICGYRYFAKGAKPGGLGDAGPPVGSRGEAPVGGMGDTKSPRN